MGSSTEFMGVDNPRRIQSLKEDRQWEAYYGLLRRQLLRRAAEEYSPTVIAPLIPLYPGTLWRWRKTRKGGWANKVPVRVVRLVELWLDEQDRLISQASEFSRKRLREAHGCTDHDAHWAQEKLRDVQFEINFKSCLTKP